METEYEKLDWICGTIKASLIGDRNRRSMEDAVQLLEGLMEDIEEKEGGVKEDG
jgi:hypothetical protein